MIIIKEPLVHKIMNKDPTFPHHNKNKNNRRHKTYTTKGSWSVNLYGHRNYTNTDNLAGQQKSVSILKKRFIRDSVSLILFGSVSTPLGGSQQVPSPVEACFLY